MSRRTCTVEGCSNPHKGNGLCKKHYDQVRQAEITRSGKRRKTESRRYKIQSVCSVDGCEGKFYGRGLCKKHYMEGFKQGKWATGTCSVQDCQNSPYGKGLCAKHYSVERRHGDPLAGRTPKTGCSVDGCGGRHHAKGLCFSHYRKKWRAARCPTHA